ncbi:PREDICTED: F-box/LRR-repeat protein At3g48880-like [Nelumbo nucifera]|uniref:F-box/LRR-repeat protein At3g48880-like n=2 Tax=Nelumbo nucifera TaxID=4432 RepID=A0A1U8BCY8_NELNU|nr:PREDICTED: F-box/LRR-repeat protein At3g48880-like [Nelumbo nucifera]DAD21251.1 TPA_asm: hypothetical protein HUJ06_022714 [Nelumbo nucifera]
MEEERKWEDMNQDCLIEVFKKVGEEAIESLILDVPFVCKSWYKASLDPQCWKALFLPKLTDTPWPPFNPSEFNNFSRRFMKEFHVQNFSVRGFLKFVISRSRRSAILLALPTCCTLEDLEFVSDEFPALQFLILSDTVAGEIDDYSVWPPMSKFKDLRGLTLGLLPNCLEEFLTDVGLNCKKFESLTMSGPINSEDALAIVTHLPTIKSLHLRGSRLLREDLKIILEGCKELCLLDVRDCVGFEVDDEILKLASRSYQHLLV